MKYFVKNKYTKGQTIEVDRNFWTGKTMIKVDGRITEKRGKNLYYYTDTQNKNIEVKLVGNEFTKIDIVVNGNTINLLRKLEVYEIILSILPFIMVFFGGAIGGGLGGLGAATLLLLMRKIKNIPLKIVLSLGVAAIVYLLWYVIASFILALF